MSDEASAKPGLANDSGFPGPTYRVELSVDGRRLPLKAFLHDVIGGGIAGLVEGLESQGPANRIEIAVERRGLGAASQSASSPSDSSPSQSS